MNRFGERLRELRKSAGVTVADIRELLGFSISYICDVEVGRRKPFADEAIVKIANHLGVDPMELRVPAASSRETINIPTTKMTDDVVQVLCELQTAAESGKRFSMRDLRKFVAKHV